MPRERKITNSVQSIERGLLILEALADAPKGMGVKELSEKLGNDMSTVHNILGTLIYHGYVNQDTETRKYHLGPAVLRLAKQYLSNVNLVAVAQPFVQSLVDRFGETVFLGTFREGLIVNHLVKLGTQPLIVNPATASSAEVPPSVMRLHCTAIGKVFLAFMDESQAEGLLRAYGMYKFTERTITDIEEIKAQFPEIRKSGVAFNREEESIGIDGVAAPIYDFSGKAIASLCIGYPAIRATPEYEEVLIRALKESTEQISRQLGFVVPQ